MNSPMMPNSAASSHSATACGRIERSVLTDWSDSSAACTSLPSAVAQPQCYLGESVKRLMLTIKGRGAPGDIGTISGLRRELHLGGMDPGDTEHEGSRPAVSREQHQS